MTEPGDVTAEVSGGGRGTAATRRGREDLVLELPDGTELRARLTLR